MTAVGDREPSRKSGRERLLLGESVNKPTTLGWEPDHRAADIDANAFARGNFDRRALIWIKARRGRCLVFAVCVSREAQCRSSCLKRAGARIVRGKISQRSGLLSYDQIDWSLDFLAMKL